jgi:hypothetical protein
MQKFDNVSQATEVASCTCRFAALSRKNEHALVVPASGQGRCPAPRETA